MDNVINILMELYNMTESMGKELLSYLEVKLKVNNDKSIMVDNKKLSAKEFIQYAYKQLDKQRENENIDILLYRLEPCMAIL